MKSKQANAIAALAAIWILSATGNALAGPDAIDSPEIGFLWCDAHKLHPFSAKVAKAVRGTFKEMGVTVEWWENEEKFAGSSPAIRLRVVVLPSEPGGAGWNLSPNVMGTVVRVGDEPIETLYLFYPNVLRSLGLNPRSGRPMAPGAWRDLSRAVAKIIAHEAIHAVVPDLSHATEGLLNDQLGCSFMQKRKARLDRRSTKRFLSELGRRSREVTAKADLGSLQKEPVPVVAAGLAKR